ncbi:OTU-like cysteine protease [Trifolium medium]|uniref:OTU-like cysteine protease n=1 Tax=Trifolium medium TaxID=97028 RepID=A0A392LW68_9FABA|nr:OTU-like cysteine protease [Trifolium medium]MCH79403.1 OTU-like cysteine protease [Trifolium medium]
MTGAKRMKGVDTVSEQSVDGNLTEPISEIFQIKHMPKFMHPYIEDIIDVDSDGYCGYRVITLDNRKDENDFECLAYIKAALLPPKRHRKRRVVALMEKWFTFPDMGHINVASALEETQRGSHILLNIDRQNKFQDLMKDEKGDNNTNVRVGSKSDDPIEL